MSFDIAIIGIANRLPGAPDPATLWSLLKEGRSTFDTLDRVRLKRAGVPEAHVTAENYVPVASMLGDIEAYDAAFFGIPAREAAVLDPQHRLFLECTWEALEDAGYDPSRENAGAIGVFAGASLNTYFIRNLACNPLFLSTPSGFLSLVSNEKDYLASRVAYKLNLHGPAVTVQTACSTSLVAVHLAMQSLILGECDMALAGGVSVKIPQEVGYLHQEGLPFSKEGNCRSFDAAGSGTVFGSGAGVVVLKPLEMAQEEGDDIYAVIRSSACNNDGNRKVGFTAPSVDGQAEVIRRAAMLADIEPSEISYVEAHATATPLGDPIEVAALAEVYGEARSTPCRIGSIKSNIGHMETAAGVAGLIKTALMLKHQRLVPSVGYKTPNPHIDFSSAWLSVQTEFEPWQTLNGSPRIAGVSSFGMGGTNIHMILEEAPVPAPVVAPVAAARKMQLMLVSAKSDSALEEAGRNLASWIEDHPQLDFASLASNLQTRRAHLPMRQAFLASSSSAAAARFARAVPGESFFGQCPETAPEMVFVYCGGGAQYPAMMVKLLESEPIFRAAVHTCAELFQPLIGEDILPYLAADRAGNAATALRMQDPLIMFPALFSVQYAMGQLFESWGLKPSCVMGHSNGEYAAAVRAGVMDLHTAVTLVGNRSALLMKLPQGGMITVPADTETVNGIAVRHGLSIGAANAPDNTVLSGELDSLEAARETIRKELGLLCKRVHVGAALHSHLTQQIAGEFAELVAKQTFQAPKMRWISSVTGGYMDPTRAPEPGYWVDHLCQTVRFRIAAETLLNTHTPMTILDLGPGRVAGDLLRQNAQGVSLAIVQAARGYSETTADDEVALAALAKIWVMGAEVDWNVFNDGVRPSKLFLPSYPWQRQRYWIDPPAGADGDDHIEQQLKQAAAVAVPEEREDRPVLTSPFVATETETEIRLLTIWQRFLGIGKIGTNDDFIELGGTSLLATELVSAINSEFGVRMELGTFLECKHIAAVSQTLDALMEERDARLLAEALAEIEGKSEEELKGIHENV